MTLQPVAVAAEATPRSRRILFYRHPMRADVTSPVPAKDEMGMDYIPVHEDEAESGDEGNVPGHASFNLSTDRQQLIGVTKAAVERRHLDLEVRAAGKVAYDPGLYQVIVEYREALRSRNTLKDSTSREAIEGANAIIRAAKLKLRQLGLSDQQLREINEAGADPINLLLPGSRAWVYAQVYEYEVDMLRQGQVAEITVPAMRGKTYTAKVVTVDPILDSATRTARVRLEVETPGKSLRPETFVHVTFRIALGEELAVPEDAVLDTGVHQIVFVVRDSGHFEPRSVKLGRIAEGYYEVLSGLAAGEQVVTSANFLIDSESRFRAALKAFDSKAPAARTD
jgi:Cu(I)/Ag(I) efflux system membrane fusion protein